MARKATSQTANIDEQPADKVRRPRLTVDQKHEIALLLKTGGTISELATRFGVSAPTIAAIKRNNRMHPDQMPNHGNTESPLRQAIYLIGFSTVMGEKVSENELSDARQKVDEARAAAMRTFALSL